MVDHYTQRATAGLIISEGTPIDPLGVGYANVPGLWPQQQTEAWKPITAAVHKAVSHIYSQIWHAGRISDPEFLNGQLPVAPSAIAATAEATFTHIARELGKRKIAFIAARERVGPDSIGPCLKEVFGGVFVANEAIDQHTGQQLLDEGKADAVAFGKLFIANPDLPARFAKGSHLNRPNAATFYAPGPEGYNDYPALQG